MADRPLRRRDPVAIGMLWLPWVRGVDARWMRFLLAFTIGLLAFLAIDALLEGTELASSGPGSLGGAALVWSARPAPTWRSRPWTAGSDPGRERLSGEEGVAVREASATRPPSWSRSASACITWGRGSRSARPTRSARSRWAPRWSSASRSTTPPRASRSSRRPRGGEGRPGSTGCCCSACWRARPPCLAPGSARRRSIRASLRSCSESAQVRLPRWSSRSPRRCATRAAASCTR